MKLYFSPGACSLSPHIVLREAGLPFELVRVDLRAHKTKDGDDYYAINPKGYVPALQLDDGSLLTEGPAIVQYLADRAPEAKLAPPNGTLERYRVQEWLAFIGTEVHKSFGPLFYPQTPEETKQALRERIGKRFSLIDQALADKPYLTGETFTVADAYLFVMTRWTAVTQIDLAAWPHLAAFAKRVEARPAVQAALEAEKAIK
jgi:glutathione S-transferase